MSQHRRPHPRRLRALGIVVAAFVAVGLAAAPALAGGDPEVSPKVTIVGKKLAASDEIGTADDPAIGKTAPTIKGRSLDGKKVTFADTGTPRILVFLSHSCPHCQAEVPEIVKLAEQGKLDGVEVQTVTTNTSEDLANYPPSKWLKREDWPFSPVLADDAKLRAFFGFGGEAFPYFVFVDADGKVAARASGELSPNTISTAAERLVAGQSLFD